MGKGDRRSRKGKIWRSSYGNARPHHKRIPALKSKATGKKK